MQPVLLECFRPSDLTTPWHERRVRVPDSFEEFAALTELTLAHFTSSTIAPEILDIGILPRARGARAIEDSCHTEPDDVYLCSGVDTFYFIRAVKAHGGVGIAVLVRVPVSRLRADMNILAPNTAKTMDEMHALHRSLLTGACAHRGAIVPATVVAVVDERGAPYQMKCGPMKT